MNIAFDPSPFITKAKVIETTEEVAAFFKRAANEDVIAVDVESAAFYRYYAKVNLIQIATRKEAAIMDPQVIKDFTPFQEFASKSKCMWLFHGGDYDISMLAKDLQIFIPRMFDTRKAAEIIGMTELGLRALTEKYLGFTLDKHLQRCDWSKRPLTKAMIEYGLLDAVCLIPVYDCLLHELDELGRIDWVMEECDSIAKQAREAHVQEPDPYAFHIKGSSYLSMRSLAVLREVWSLREEIAESIDRAPFMLLSNQSLLEIARVCPRSIAGLNTIKGMNHDFLAKYGSNLQKAIRAGLEAELVGLERPVQKHSREELLNAWEGELAKAIREVRDKVAARENIPPSVLAPSHALYSLAKARPQTVGELVQSEILHDWQARLLADEVIPLLEQEPPKLSKKARRRRRTSRRPTL
ncbi:MAG: HRDC domain-containing protein [Candidatus Riflebacteria bacterium]|nr:HRDC domain-containing protein [Candidatus Riflebacteria bacterium]